MSEYYKIDDNEISHYHPKIQQLIKNELIERMFISTVDEKLYAKESNYYCINNNKIKKIYYVPNHFRGMQFETYLSIICEIFDSNILKIIAKKALINKEKDKLEIIKEHNPEVII